MQGIMPPGPDHDVPGLNPSGLVDNARGRRTEENALRDGNSIRPKGAFQPAEMGTTDFQRIVIQGRNIGQHAGIIGIDRRPDDVEENKPAAGFPRQRPSLAQDGA